MRTIVYTGSHERRSRGGSTQSWPPGPWDQEPDKAQWLDAETGLPCLVVRGPMGCWCGYVAVPASHPCYGLDYADAEARYGLEAHGGLTFADRCGGPVCHQADPGEDDDVWWLGFDCGHAFDVVPAMLALEAEMLERDPAYRELSEHVPAWMQNTYRTLAYVRHETVELARQLAAIG